MHKKGDYEAAVVEYSDDATATLDAIAAKHRVQRSKLRRLLIDRGIRLHRRARKYFFDEDYFASINTEEKAYWLGFICADGYVAKRHVSIKLAAKDRSHLEKFARLFAVPVFDCEETHSNGEVYKKSYCTLGSVKLAGTLREKGLDNRKTFSLSPSIYDFVPTRLHSHFVRGYFDGDGCIHCADRTDCTSRTRGVEWSFSLVGTKDFLARTHATIGIGDAKPYKRKKVWGLTIGGNCQIKKIREWLYRDCSVCMSRKHDIFARLT